MPDPILIQYGNQYNILVQVFYIESDSEVSGIPEEVPAGSIALVNEAQNFHALMKNRAGDWNVM